MNSWIHVSAVNLVSSSANVSVLLNRTLRDEPSDMQNGTTPSVMAAKSAASALFCARSDRQHHRSVAVRTRISARNSLSACSHMARISCGRHV